jgi:hypothetical protein
VVTTGPYISYPTSSSTMVDWTLKQQSCLTVSVCASVNSVVIFSLAELKFETISDFNFHVVYMPCKIMPRNSNPRHCPEFSILWVPIRGELGQFKPSDSAPVLQRDIRRSSVFMTKILGVGTLPLLCNT